MVNCFFFFFLSGESLLDTGVLYLILITASVVALIIYLIFHRVAFKNLFKTLRGYDRYKYGFYECGFKPKFELSVNFTFQTYVMFSLVILYDVEGFFLLLFFLNLNTLCLVDLALIGFYIGLLFLGFWFEATTKSADWVLY